jgi:hypothetical protein
MRLIGLNTPLRVVTHWCGNSMYVAYLGVDPITRKQKRTTRRGFKTEREAKIAEAKLQTVVIAC